MIEKMMLMRAAHTTEVEATEKVQLGKFVEGWIQMHSMQITSEISANAAHASSHHK
jgi:hypothetical protein